MSTNSRLEVPVALCDKLNEAICKLKALELMLSTRPLYDALDQDAASGVAYLFDHVIHDFESVRRAIN